MATCLLDVHVVSTEHTSLVNVERRSRMGVWAEPSAVNGLWQAGGQIVLLCRELCSLPAVLHQSVKHLLTLLHEPLVGVRYVQLHHGLCNTTTAVLTRSPTTPTPPPGRHLTLVISWASSPEPVQTFKAVVRKGLALLERQREGG